MNTLADRLVIEIPPQMRTLERDHRGYPIPYIVLRDRTGMPQFTINDYRAVEKCITKRLCAICGKRLAKWMWFVGGSRCFMHPDGAFLDPPSHMACATYALQVCPFLAAPSYGKRIDDKRLTPERRPINMALVHIEDMLPDRPEWLGLGATTAYQRKDSHLIVDRWDYVEFWQKGEQVNAPLAVFAAEGSTNRSTK